MELREKIAREVDTHAFEERNAVYKEYVGQREEALEAADAILAIPEIRDALFHYERKSIFPKPGDIA